MIKRHRLPDRRLSKAMPFKHQGMPYTAMIGFYPDGLPGEVFVDNNRLGSAVAHLAQDVAVLISIAMQYGVLIGVMRDGMGRAEGQPQSVAGAVLDMLQMEASAP